MSDHFVITNRYGREMKMDKRFFKLDANGKVRGWRSRAHAIDLIGQGNVECLDNAGLQVEPRNDAWDELTNLPMDWSDMELRIFETEAAARFDYPLCRCTFPPHIMLLQTKEVGNVYQCPHCKRKWQRPGRHPDRPYLDPNSR